MDKEIVNLIKKEIALEIKIAEEVLKKAEAKLKAAKLEAKAAADKLT